MRNPKIGWLRGALVQSLRDIVLGCVPFRHPCGLLVLSSCPRHHTQMWQHPLKEEMFSLFFPSLFIGKESLLMMFFNSIHLTCHWPEMSNKHLQRRIPASSVSLLTSWCYWFSSFHQFESSSVCTQSFQIRSVILSAELLFSQNSQRGNIGHEGKSHIQRAKPALLRGCSHITGCRLG